MRPEGCMTLGNPHLKAEHIAHTTQWQSMRTCFAFTTGGRKFGIMIARLNTRELRGTTALISGPSLTCRWKSSGLVISRVGAAAAMIMLCSRRWCQLALWAFSSASCHQVIPFGSHGTSDSAGKREYLATGGWGPQSCRQQAQLAQFVHVYLPLT